MNMNEIMPKPKKKQSFFASRKADVVLSVLIFALLVILICLVATLIKNNRTIENITDKNEMDINEVIISDNENVNNSNYLAENTAVAQQDILFILGISEGKIAVFNADKTVIYQTFNVYADTLPEYDRFELQNDILIYSTDELYSLIEAFTS